MASKIPGQGRSLIKDQFYVIKVIDVAEVPEKIGLEALQEIETMGQMDPGKIFTKSCDQWMGAR